ncbi:MAG TPA: plastocyanin/azurin family copper-binding protein [Thermomicrobiales bacterium]|nr:plastocyanin/azurin family copper-binding protein [Thermomicrobiales bacterium]
MNDATFRTTDLLDNLLTRRKALKLLGAAGIATASLPQTIALAHQGEHEGASPAASQAPGPREDGSMLWSVQVGGMDMDNAIDFHAFFPREITINAGDGILFNFAPMGRPQFHTVTFTSGEELPPLFVPDMADGTPVVSDEGAVQLQINLAVAWPDGRTEYDGTGMTNSGLDVLRTEDQGPYILNFTEPGTYEYACVVHAVVMKGTVVVQEAGAEYPNDQAGYDAMGQEEMAGYTEEALDQVAELEGMVATPSAQGPTTWDVVAGAGGLTSARVMSFIPRELTVKAGDTVRWTVRSDGEPHTVTFLGGEEPPEDVLIEPQSSGSPKILQNNVTFLPSGGPEHDGTAYANSGFMALPPEINEMFGLVGETFELTFTEPGEYPYYCILHSSGPESEGPMEMNGRIIVEG